MPAFLQDMAAIDVDLSPYFIDFMCLFDMVVNFRDPLEDTAMSDAPTVSQGSGNVSALASSGAGAESHSAPEALSDMGTPAA